MDYSYGFEKLPNSGTNSFANLVLTGFGFTDLQTMLVGIPSSFISFFAILITWVFLAVPPIMSWPC